MSTDQLDLFGPPQPLEEFEQLHGQPSDIIGELPAEPLNPRWLLYVSARGGSVESGGMSDNARFMGWVSSKIAAFERVTGSRTSLDHAAFDEWLRAHTTPGEVEAAMREDES